MSKSGVQRDFHHPYTPYPIQEEFMSVLYDVIEDGCVGILESPTGTGKSLSLICGALTWLRNHRSQDLEAQLRDDEKDSNEPEWVLKFAREEKKKKLLEDKLELEARLKSIREKEQREKAQAEARERYPKKSRRALEVTTDGDDEDQFLLDDYESDRESNGRRAPTSDGDSFSPEVKELMKKLGMLIPGDSRKDEAGLLDMPDETKIFFCSRTHSQLSQFVNELRKVNIPPSFPADYGEAVTEQIKHLSLGSRKNLCINPNVAKLRSVTAINEKCLDLQKSGTSEEKRCQFLPKNDQVAVRDFRDHALAGIRDIEDLGKLGKKMGICPYYSSRPAIKPSEIVTLPYPLLLQKSAREALDISLKGHVVIIDEAHNLMDAISSLYSITVTLPQLIRCNEQLEFYLAKFKNRLKGSNKVYVMQTSRFIQSLVGYLQGLVAKRKECEVNTGDLLSFKGMDQINFFKLQTYLSESKLPRKLEGYIIHRKQKEEELRSRPTSSTSAQAKSPESVPVLMHIQGFLLALTNPSDEGKIFFGYTENKESYLKYMLLDPAFHFREVVEEARSVVLAGGTMQPMEDYKIHLFPYVPMDKIRTLSCGHVIPKENLLAWPMVKGLSGKDFDFTYEKRMDPLMIADLGRAIGNLCMQIPCGVVAFFPSYSYLDFVVTEWQKTPTGGGPSIWDKLSKTKPIFRESNEKSGVEETLQEYGQAIDAGRGGLLLGVVGGKMSEGINFNDNLGRGVLMIGLPFPNIKSPEWAARLQHVESVAYNSHASESCISDDPSRATLDETKRKAVAKAAGREFYENACMRAVNQSIGRAIRHREDYATIILIDKRYASARIREKLPGWIQSGLVNVDINKGEGRVVDVMQSCGRFFRQKAQR